MSNYNETIESNMTARASDIEFNYVVEKLSPNTTYRFRVYGYNINGNGPQSELYYFTTKGKKHSNFQQTFSEIQKLIPQFATKLIINAFSRN